MPDYRLVRQDPATRLILHGEEQARAAASRAWGLEFSAEPCRARTLGARATLWLGPDEYLLWDRARAALSELPGLERALQGTAHALVDISDRQQGFELSGSDAATALSGACPLDLRLREFPVGMCTRTVFAKTEILLWRTAADDFHVEVWRSFAPYFEALLRQIGIDL